MGGRLFAAPRTGKFCILAGSIEPGQNLPRMSELHGLLWTLCRKLPSDFAPYGERDRDTAEPCADCSCGCRHFIPLEGELGNDWGVCANTNSPRAGLLTFEHQGCPQFESEAGPEVEPAPAPPTEDAPTITRDVPLRKLKIDFEELLLALEGFGEPLGEPIENYLDTETGEIIPLHDDFDDAEEIRERIDADLGERYRSIEPLESHESFRIMENFAASLPESRLKTRLFDALARHKPFRHFRDIIHADLALRDRWFAFRDDALAQHARDWLESLGIEAELQRRQQ